MSWLVFFVLLSVLLLVFWTVAALVLEGPDLTQFDEPSVRTFNSHVQDEGAASAFLETIQLARQRAVASKSLKAGLTLVREFANNLSAGLVSDAEFLPVQIGDLTMEWTTSKGTNPKRRVLFFHGGAFFLGSAFGHRKFSDRLARVCNAAVLSVNYRMLPEHPRTAGIRDAQLAYQWILENGPNGAEACDFLVVAGDSAGGNLAFMLSSWSQIANLTRPDAVLGFSPSLDSSISAPSFRYNRLSDKIIGPNVGRLKSLPRPIFLWLALVFLRMRPTNPLVSPIFYDLTNLPPTLIQASSNEMLLGDAIRYTNKARASGSEVVLQIWQNQLHDWHLFNMGQGSAEDAWSQVERFIQKI